MTRPEKKTGLAWPHLLQGTLIKRYKRFLADVKLDSGEIVTAHCPNSGSMKACSQPDRTVYISRADNPKRKLKFTWEIIDMGSSLVGVNTQVPNRLVAHGIMNGHISELDGYDDLKREVTTSPGSRLDIGLYRKKDVPDCFVEVKSCTLVTDGSAMFPDAVTARGLKHLNELIRLKKEGHRAVIFYLIQRSDAKRFEPAAHIDPAYADGLKTAIAAGVEALAYDVTIDMEQIRMNQRLPIRLPASTASAPASATGRAAATKTG